ncbi:MAG: LapA family protein [Desulfurivibrionaceae bacterium]
MMRYINIAIIVLALAIIAIFKLQNLETVTISFLTVSLTLPASLLILLVYLLGMLTGSSLLALIRTLISGAKKPTQ